MLEPKTTPEAAPAATFLPSSTPTDGSANMAPTAAPSISPADSTVAPAMEDPEADKQTIITNLTAHLDSLADPDKQFLAEHLTPEFVRAIGLINGPEVAEYLNQFANPNKVLVPVPRQIAEQYLAQQQAEQGKAAPQGQPQSAQGGAPAMAPPSQPPVSQAPAAPQAGMMQPPM